MNKNFILIICLLLFTIQNTNAQNKLKVIDLRTEYEINPLGIDVTLPRLSWKIISNERNVIQTAYQLKAAVSKEDLKNGKSLLWDTKKVISDQSVNIEYKGTGLHSGVRVYWQVRVYDNKNNVSDWSDIAYWEMGFLNSDDWKASWIMPALKEDTAISNPCPMLRKEFNLQKKINHARLYVSCLGLYLPELNGKKVSDWLFTPGWTSYKKRLQYQVYDVTTLLKTGQNAVGVTLGDGWYRGFLGGDGKKNNYYGSKLALILQLEITYVDNTKELIVSDNTWKASTGPILKSSIYNGEFYDARLEKNNWSNPGYNDKDWKPVLIIQHSAFNIQHLVATVGPPVRRIQELKPVRVFKDPKGETILDMGQNMVGWIRFSVTGKAGAKITLRHAEILDKAGNFYTDNLRNAMQKDEYILKGGNNETFEPHFTFHGFRYVAIEGYPGEVKPENFIGVVIHSDMIPTGKFSCSDSMVNKLQHNILWGLKGNFLNIPTDCPQRDERLGWTGDAEVFAPTACFNMDAASFYTKWLKDMKVDQLKSGAIIHVVPDIYNHGGAAGWADAAVIIPWTLYLAFGDTRILEEQYATMKDWVNYMKNQAGDAYIWSKGRQYGDWWAFCACDPDYPGATTDKDLVATAYFANSTDLLQKTAALLGKKEDADYYRDLLNKIKKAFSEEFLTQTGRLSSNTQTAYTLSLAFNLIPEELKAKAAERLADDVKKIGHLTTGFLGTPLICKELTDYGYADLAYQLLLNKNYPSWIYPITMGATTFWERWNGIHPDSTIEENTSYNHYAYGAVGYWLYSNVAGIQNSPDAPGYKKIIINPHLGSKFTFARAEYESVYGKIKSNWNIADKEFKINIIVPPNTTAEVHIPSVNPDLIGIKENNKPVKTIIDIKFIESKNGQSIFLIGSGDYTFTTKLDN